MITLYHCTAARSFRVLWALEELRLAYELKLLAFPPRFRQPDYLDINPLGTIPLLLDGDVRMTESVAILQYLASIYGPTPLAVTSEEAGFADYLNFLHFGEATLTFPQAIYFRYATLEAPEKRQPQVAEDYARWFRKRMIGIEAQLARQEWLAADRFTCADISVGYALQFAHFLKLDNEFSEHVQAYAARLRQRPAYLRARIAEKPAAAI
ncbi:MAG: glutathione S-transferase family protein [Hyphomicrobiales bacterium]|nr:glutathione S-transferase family protein [Hyphomicrobiales bacterium]